MQGHKYRHNAHELNVCLCSSIEVFVPWTWLTSESPRVVSSTISKSIQTVLFRIFTNKYASVVTSKCFYLSYMSDTLSDSFDIAHAIWLHLSRCNAMHLFWYSVTKSMEIRRLSAPLHNVHFRMLRMWSTATSVTRINAHCCLMADNDALWQ